MYLGYMIYTQSVRALDPIEYRWECGQRVLFDPVLKHMADCLYITEPERESQNFMAVLLSGRVMQLNPHRGVCTAHTHAHTAVSDFALWCAKTFVKVSDKDHTKLYLCCTLCWV